MTVLAATFSIAAAGPDGQLGVASSSCVLGVGGRCPHVVPGLVALASQAYMNPHLSTAIAGAMRRGEDVATALEAALDGDDASGFRQVLAVDVSGTAAVHTGADADPWAGHRTGEGCVAAGNLLTGPETVDAMLEAFMTDLGAPFPERLVRALEAGQDAGGDRRGRQSASLLVHGPLEPSFVDLRVDDHADPVAELRRLYDSLSPELLERSWRMASTRSTEPASALRARQARVRAQLEPRGRS